MDTLITSDHMMAKCEFCHVRWVWAKGKWENISKARCPLCMGGLDRTLHWLKWPIHNLDLASRVIQESKSGPVVCQYGRFVTSATAPVECSAQAVIRLQPHPNILGSERFQAVFCEYHGMYMATSLSENDPQFQRMAEEPPYRDMHAKSLARLMDIRKQQTKVGRTNSLGRKY